MSRAKLYSIAPHGKFLEVLADRILDGTLLGDWPRSGPFWLSDVTILLPTKRARLKLAEILAQRLGGAALLPDIRSLGAEPGETEAPFLPPIDAPAPLPVAGALERRLTLSRLVAAFARGSADFASPPNAAEILWLADSLGELIDDLTIETVDIAALDNLVPADLAANWQDILKFLDPALKAWPGILAERGKVDAAAARNGALQRQAATAELLFGNRPVIAAGSTGSIPATAELLRAIAQLERGALVLPGLDTSLSANQHEQLLDGDNTHSHPQYGLAKLLRALGAGISQVIELAGEAPRTALLRGALAPADKTTHWAARRGTVAIDTALEGVGVLAAPNADLEARAIALAARQAIVEGQTVGIVSRDQTLARRIAAELKRHAIEVDDPAGTPLYQSGAGRLARQVLSVAVGQYSPVDVVALLRNKAVTFGLERRDIRRQTDRLDNRLRGKRPRRGLAGMLEFADESIRDVLDRLGDALRPLCDLLERPQIDARDLAGALSASLTALAGDGEVPGSSEFRTWAGEIGASTDTGAAFEPAHLDGVLAALMAGAKVQSGERRRDDIHIWGELEARLQSPDLMIIAGVNEDIWPAAADPGPWMSRGMRVAIGLAPPERQQGQAAHDFEMALGNRQVLIAYAERIGTSPALPSRFVQRLDAFIGEDAAKALRLRGAKWLADARAIDFAGRPRPATRPVPNPPAADRPRELSITDVEPLMRSPYDIYAKRTLRLRRREPLGSEPDARERGTMIHTVFERFITDGHRFDAADARAVLAGMAEQEFSRLDAIEERRDIWLRRFRRAAEQFLAFEQERDGEIAERAAEREAAWVLPAFVGFTLKGKADRIDLRRDGTLEILDFKTGGVPTPKDMMAYDAPQLLLEAAMARAGVFPGIAPHDSSALTYIKIGFGPAAFQLKPFKLRPGVRLMDAVDDIMRRTQGHIDAFLMHDGLPMAARIRPRVETGRKSWPGDYDHLARTDEWTLTSGVDDP
jgi:ATP-dependent helicase/nuclease subunit B